MVTAVPISAGPKSACKPGFACANVGRGAEFQVGEESTLPSFS